MHILNVVHHGTTHRHHTSCVAVVFSLGTWGKGVGGEFTRRWVQWLKLNMPNKEIVEYKSGFEGWGVGDIFGTVFTSAL